VSINQVPADTGALRRKYNVYRCNEDGSNGEKLEGFTFTLRLEDPLARVVLLEYADRCRKSAPELSVSLINVLLEFENQSGGMMTSIEECDLHEFYRSSSSILWHSEKPALPDEIEILDSNGDAIAVAVHESYAGSLDDPGYDFWRFATIKEIESRVNKADGKETK
jgi:hypothetical protein